MAAVSSSAPHTDHPCGPLRSPRNRWFQCRGAAQADVQCRVELPGLGEDLAQGPGADRDQQRALGVTACPDSPVGCDPGKVSVSELAQHGPRHLVGLGQERERCALVIALVVLGCLLRLGDEVGDLAAELGVAGGLPEPPGRIDTGPRRVRSEECVTVPGPGFIAAGSSV